MAQNNVIKYRADIDGLRAIAVLLVLVFHFDLFALGKGGFLGVDIFFVISGFLITTIITNQLDAGRFSFSGFYIKRIKRLAPALFVVLLGVMVVGAVVLFPSDYVELAKQFFATQFYFSNIYFWQNINYFGLSADSVPLLHTWSLAVEEQFYLVFPLFSYLIYRYYKNYFWHFVLFGLVLSFLLNIYFVQSKPALTFYFMPTRAWELLSGSLLVLFIKNPIFKNKLLAEILAFSGLGLIILSVLLYSKEINFPGFYAVLPVAGSMFLILSGNNANASLVKFISHDAIVYIGKISYSLYLVHWPINVFSKIVLGDDYDIFWRFGMFFLSFACSVILFHMIENPFRRGQLFNIKINVPVAYVATLASSVLIFLFIYISNGLPGRFPDEVVRVASFTNDKPPLMRECQYNINYQYIDENFCRIGGPGSKPTWIVFGDSHAWAMKEAFNIWLKRRGESGVFIFRAACPPIKDIFLFKANSECNSFNEKIYDHIGKSDSIKNVVLVSTWIQAKEGKLSNSSSVKLNSEESINLFKDRFSKSVKYLFSMDKNTYVWEPVPGAKGNVPKKWASTLLDGNFDHELEFTTSEYKSNIQFFLSAINKNKNYIRQTFSPAKVLCDKAKCKIDIEGVPVYFDNSHLSYSLSGYWANVLEQQLIIK